MENSNKVVPIQRRSGATKVAADESHLFARIPAPFVEMKDKGKLVLQSLLQNLFDNIDDALFELADRAEKNSEQNMYFESMREIRIKRRGVELAYGHVLDEAFLSLLGESVPTLASEADIPTLSAGDELAGGELKLVENDELEELIAIDAMVAKAERQYQAALKPLNTRLDSMVDGQAVTDKNNPFGPDILCKSFLQVCGDLDLGIKAKLVLFKLFDRYVMNDLGKVYALSNQVLIDGGILPKLHQSRRRASAPAAPQQPVPTVTDSLEQAPAATGDVFASLQDLLHQHQPELSNAASGLVAPGRAPQIPRDTLLQLLQAVQQDQTPSLAEQQQNALLGSVPDKLDIHQALSGLLTRKMPNKTMSVGQVDSDAINLVAMLFQFILDDRNLAAPIKGLIARLQIPIIKVAMLDKSFFSKGGHPARKLLNEIANASLGWAPGANIERDPLYLKVSEIVDKLLNEFESDPSIFHDTLADFIAFVELDKHRAQLVEQRTINAEDGKAKSELARARVQEVLNQKVAGKSLPKVVITLLEEAWSNVMFLVVLKEGEQSEEWSESQQVVDDLLWSVEPKHSPESRQKLLKTVPELLRQLRTGLTRIGFNPFEMNQLFADLEAIHLTLLKELNTSAPARSTSPASKAEKTRVIEQTLDQMLDGEVGADVSLEKLDAELDQQLAKFDELANLVEASAVPETAQVEAGNSDAADWEVVEQLKFAGGARPADSAEPVELEENDPCLALVDRMAMGNWIELHQDGGKKFRCRLAAVIRGADKYIFVNRSGMKVAEYNRHGLATAIKQGKVSTLDEGLLFDRALESVIGNLRDMKVKPA